MSRYKIRHTGYCCCGGKRYTVYDSTTNKYVSIDGLKKKEAQDVIKEIESLES